jgi:hypothetical protein
MQPERIVVSPGPCTPQEAGISIELIRHFAGKVPLLGVCLGHQAIGAAFGGQVVRAKNLMHGKTSQVEHDGKTIFRGLSSPMTATRYHSLIVSPKTACQTIWKSAPGPATKTEPASSWAAPPEVCGRGRAVSSRERADGRGEETGGEFPARQLLPQHRLRSASRSELRLCVPTGTTMSRRTIAPPTGTTARNGLQAASSLGSARGFMAQNFHGHVNNRFHPEHGYSGPRPARGDKPEPGKRLDKVAHFKGNEVRDGRGHAVGKR